MQFSHPSFAFTALAVFLLPAIAPAADRHQTTDDLTAESDKVVLGTVSVKSSRWGADSRIYTDLVITPDVTIKGQEEGPVMSRRWAA